MSLLIKKEGFVYVGRRELLRSGHYQWYALGVEAEHGDAWVEHQRQTFREATICQAEDWPNNSTILGYYRGPPPGVAIDPYLEKLKEQKRL